MKRGNLDFTVTEISNVLTCNKQGTLDGNVQHILLTDLEKVRDWYCSSLPVIATLLTLLPERLNRKMKSLHKHGTRQT